ncbi:Uncharacterised protein [Delftia tsuruhatensis]|nr:Uncharacterised protein [Delftia tsuruhatensis]CAC9690543.1 Uncharacterised protein [Delftia tsuruhatensis]
MSVFRNLVVAGGLAMACMASFAQGKPSSVADAGQGGSRQIDPYAQAVQQMEAILSCRPGAAFDARAVEARWEAFGMRKGRDGIFLPPANAPAVSLFGDEVVAALVTDADGEKKAVAYLKKQSGKQLARKLGVRQIDEQANTDEPSYFKATGKKTTLLVGSADELAVGAGGKGLRFNASVACQLIP